MKIALVVQVKDSRSYLPVFLAHHLRLVDDIYLIDHNSSVDYRQLGSKRLIVSRSTVGTYSLDTHINAVIYHFSIIERYDWLFVLDIDEFLPFIDRQYFEDFLRSSSAAECLCFRWQNGIIDNADRTLPAKLTPNSPVLFSNHRAHTQKLFFKLSGNRELITCHGNHRAIFPLLGLKILRRNVSVIDSGLPLYHLPFLSMTALEEKLATFPKENFFEKVILFPERFSDKYGPEWRLSQLDREDLLWLVANYRERRPERLLPAGDAEFSRSDLFSGLDDDVSSWARQLEICRPAQQFPAIREEYETIKRISRTKGNYRRQLMRLVSITPDMTIRMTVPGHDGLSSHGPAEEKMMTAVSQEESRARIALSVVMIAKNEAAVIGDAIRSARFADEVVVLDNGSTDRTCEIARELGAVVHTGEWLGFGAQKNKAVSLARHDWVFVLDCDERITPELQQEITTELQNPACSAYRVARLNRFFGTFVRYGGLYPDYSIRLFDRRNARFNELPVHESVLAKGSVGRLHEHMIHLAYDTIEEFIAKQNRYSSLQDRQRSKMKALLHPHWKFFKLYVLKAGFRDGWNGFVLARLYAQYTFWKYVK